MSFQDDYYETRRVKSGRRNYTCVFCYKPIPVGTPSETHKYYPEFNEYRTHPECSDDFLKSETCDYCGEFTTVLYETKDQTLDNEVVISKCCKGCHDDSIADPE